MSALPPANDEIADVLEQVADLLEAQRANPYRVRAWRGGARTARSLARPLADLLAEGGEGALEALPGIGPVLARAIGDLVRTGRLALLERLEGQVAPEDLFTTVPGLGPELARRAHEGTGAETLEDLEVAAHDGRLAAVPGFGERRVRAVRDALAAVLGRRARQRARGRAAPRAPVRDGAPPEPDVAAILAVDADYRRGAEAGDLPRITPRRFNPRREAWLPILHAEREGWSFTALYSNTARAHELGTTRDWVVIFGERGGVERRWTVVTESRGPLRGRRVVRGREMECLDRLEREEGGAGGP